MHSILLLSYDESFDYISPGVALSGSYQKKINRDSFADGCTKTDLFNYIKEQSQASDEAVEYVFQQFASFLDQKLIYNKKMFAPGMFFMLMCFTLFRQGNIPSGIGVICIGIIIIIPYAVKYLECTDIMKRLNNT